MPNGDSGAPPWSGTYKGQIYEYGGQIWEWSGFSWFPSTGTPTGASPTPEAQLEELVKVGEETYRGQQPPQEGAPNYQGYEGQSVTNESGIWLFQGGGWSYQGPPPAAAPAPEPPTAVPGEEDFSAQLAAAVEAYQQQIREMGERERAEAQRLGARDIGKMSRQAQQALLAQGRTAGEIEQLMAGGMEAGARSLSDLIQALNIQEQRQLAGAEQFGIGTMISGEELATRERQMAQQMAQYQQSFAEQQRQFGVGAGQWQQQFGQQASQFAQQLGLSQQQLAQLQQYQQGQLGLGQQQAQAGIWGPLFGALGTIGGAYLGGPLGAGVGGQVGSQVGGWFG